MFLIVAFVVEFFGAGDKPLGDTVDGIPMPVSV
jgi:hypothetical protein